MIHRDIGYCISTPCTCTESDDPDVLVGIDTNGEYCHAPNTSSGNFSKAMHGNRAEEPAMTAYDYRPYDVHDPKSIGDSLARKLSSLTYGSETCEGTPIPGLTETALDPTFKCAFCGKSPKRESLPPGKSGIHAIWPSGWYQVTEPPANPGEGHGLKYYCYKSCLVLDQMGVTLQVEVKPIFAED